MKAPTFPQTVRERRVALRDVAIPHAMDHLDNTDLTQYVSLCGTRFCILGWYLHLFEGLNHWDLRHRVSSVGSALIADGRDPLFHFTEDQWLAVFGTAHRELPDAMTDLKYRRNLINELMA